MSKQLSRGEQYDVKVMAEIVADYYGLTMDEFTMNTRKRHIVHPRHMYHYICHKIKGFTTYKSASVTGKNHATVLNSCKQIEDWLTYDRAMQSDLKNLLKIIDRGWIYHQIQGMIDEIPFGKLPKVKEDLEKYIIA